MQQADVVIIGSGQGGVPLAKAFAEEGRRVLLFERAKYGGTCVNYGCLPSKAFLASAHAAGQARRAGAVGVHAEVTVDFPAVMARARAVTASSTENVKKGLLQAGVQLVQGEATFHDEQTVQGGNTTVTAPLIVINTGKSSRIPAIDGLDQIDVLTYESFWQINALPPRILLVGGGYVGVELGQGLARLGSQVHILERSQRIVSHEEEAVSQVLQEALQADGVTFTFGAAVRKVAKENGTYTLTLSNGETMQGEALLLSVGRRANTAALNVEAAGIALDDQGHIQVDEHFRTTNPHVYAIGDVTGQPAFTHVSWEDYRRLKAILDGKERRQGDRVLVYAFFTDPEVGRAGLTLAQAQQQGYAAKAVTMPLSEMTRANLLARARGFYRLVIDEQSDKILGATLVGPQTAELIHVFIAHMVNGATWQVLERSQHIHPTFGESLPGLARKLMG
ncbi:MAG: FAD-dependent oxidoreductase [Caldilineaceae bacterium]